MFKLTPDLDPRRTHYYNIAFPHLTKSQKELLRKNWIIKNIKPLSND